LLIIRICCEDGLILETLQKKIPCFKLGALIYVQVRT